MTNDADVAPVLDTSVPHPARRYNYWLGGKDNFAADRVSGDAIAAVYPSIRTAAVENRRFLERAVTFLAAECGIRQFIDVGTGIPVEPYPHEIVARHHAHGRIVYVDNDPLVVAHARALLVARTPALTGHLEADLRDPSTIARAAEMHEVLDLSEPVGLMLVAVLHFVSEAEQPAAIIKELVEALPVGSYVAMSHATLDPVAEPVAAMLDGLAGPSAGNGPFHSRSRHEICELIRALDPVGPGVVPITEWRPDLTPKPQATFAEAACYGVVARKI